MKTVITEKRIQQYENLQRILVLAGSLNSGSNIVGKIQELETLCNSLKGDFNAKDSNDTAGFVSYISDAIRNAAEIK